MMLKTMAFVIHFPPLIHIFRPEQCRVVKFLRSYTYATSFSYHLLTISLVSDVKHHSPSHWRPSLLIYNTPKLSDLSSTVFEDSFISTVIVTCKHEVSEFKSILQCDV